MKYPSFGIKVCSLLFIILNAFLAGAQSVQELQYLISQPELTKKEK
tara:strand:- start:455 stop:592 length:138 start_codon:yes stop_codon:yes gene_type:complete